MHMNYPKNTKKSFYAGTQKATGYGLAILNHFH